MDRSVNNVCEGMCVCECVKIVFVRVNVRERLCVCVLRVCSKMSNCSWGCV